MLRSLLAAMGVVAILGACSSTTPSPSGQVATAAPRASASAGTLAASVAPSGGSVDLKALLPGKVGKVGLSAVQFTGPELDQAGAVDDRLKGLLTSLGRDVEDLTMAIASDATRASDLSITAFKVRDVPVQTFLTGYVPLLQQNYGNDAISHTTRAGRDVYVAQPPGGVAPQVLVARDDVLFVVVGSDSGLVDEAIGQLP